MPPKNDTPSAVRKLCFPRTVPVSWSSGLRFHMQGSQEWQAPVGWPLGSISTIGNQVKNQLTHCRVGAECRDFPAPQSQPRDPPQEAINSIYRGIIGHLQNQAFPGSEVDFLTCSVKEINEDQLASYTKRTLNKKEKEVERDGLNHCHIQWTARAFPTPGPPLHPWCLIQIQPFSKP